MNIIDEITLLIGNNFGDVFLHKSALLCKFAAAPFTICFCTYFIICLFEYKDSGISTLFKDYTKYLIGWFFVTIFAFNAEVYYYLANILYNLPEELMAIINPNNTPALFSTVWNNFLYINDSISKILEILSWFNNSGVIIELYEAKIAIYFTGTILTGIIFAHYIIAKIILSLILLIGPLFIGFLLFRSTRQWGMNWIGQVANQILLIFLYVTVTLIEISYIQARIDMLLYPKNGVNYLNPKEIDASTLLTFNSELLLLTILFIFILWKLPNITSALFGGASTEGLISGGIRTIAFPFQLLNKNFRNLNSGKINTIRSKG